MNATYDLNFEEISEIHTINPETAAHNIASAYIHSAYSEINFPTGESVDFKTIAEIAKTYEYAYNYAYNHTVHQNKLINEVE